MRKPRQFESAPVSRRSLAFGTPPPLVRKKSLQATQPKFPATLLVLPLVAILVGFYLLQDSPEVIEPEVLELVQEPLTIEEEIISEPPLEPQFKTVNYSVASGDTWSGIFAKLGLERSDAEAVGKSLSSLSKKQKVKTVLQIGQQLEFELEDSGFTKITTALGPGEKISVNRGEDGVINAVYQPLPRIREKRVIAGVIDTTFAGAAVEAGLSYDLIDDVVDLFADRVAFHRDIQPGDGFAVVFEEDALEDGTALGNGKIVGATILVAGEQHYAIQYAGPDGKKRFFDGKGELLGESFLRYPLKFSRISSTFSHARLHPILKRRMPHRGVDFAAPRGTPVRSVSDGTVTFAARKGPNGIMVKIRHGKRYRTAYLHLHRIAKGIRKGSKVKRGQVIGTVGSTGRSTGPHLDFRFYDNGKSVDPLTVKLPQVVTLNKSERISKSYLKEAIATLNVYQEQLELPGILSSI